MAEIIKKYILKQKINPYDTLVMYPKTTASQVMEEKNKKFMTEKEKKDLSNALCDITQLQNNLAELNLSDINQFQNGTNSAYGKDALLDSTGGANSAFGYSALSKNKTGVYNTGIGTAAGKYCLNGNTALIDASHSVFIGGETRGSDHTVEHNQTNQIVIGFNAKGGGSNSITLGNQDITKLQCQVTAITALSDARVKEDIKKADLELCYKAVKDLPVSRYKYKDFTGKHVDTNVTGWMADDVEKVFPKSVSKSNQYFPVLDSFGNKTYEEIEEKEIEIVDGLEVEKVRTRKVEKMFMLEGVKDITMTEALPTLWGAVQQLMKKVEELEFRLNRRTDRFDR